MKSAIPTLLICSALLGAADPPKPKRELTLEQKYELAQARLRLAQTEAAIQSKMEPLKYQLISANTSFFEYRNRLLASIGAATDGTCDFDSTGTVACQEPKKTDPPKPTELKK